MIATISIGAFLLTGAFAGYRLLRGPSLGDRVAALDVMLVSLMSGIAIDAAATGDSTSLDLLVVIAVVGFTTTVAASRFIEHTGPEEGTP
jgi:multisubunit Na+/H+ antiporter MnhF subunit